MVALKLRDTYDLILEDRMLEVSAALTISMQASPYFMEIKIKMIEQYIHLMDYDSIQLLLSVFEKLHKEVRTNSRHNFCTCNTNPLAIAFSIYRISQEIIKLFPRLKTRVTSFQYALVELFKDSIEKMSPSPRNLAQVMKFRDYTGRSVLELFYETNVLEFLQVRVIESGIQTLWDG